MDFAQLAQQLGMAEEDRASFLAITGKYPIAEAIVPKSQYVKAQSAFEEAESFVKKWETFRDTAWDEEHGMTRRQYEAEQDAVLLRAKVAQMEAGTYVPSGESMDFADVERYLVEKGYAKSADLTGYAKKEEVASTVDTKLNQHGFNQEFFFTRSAAIPMKYMAEFGSVDDFDMAEFMNLVVSNLDRFAKDATGQPVKQFTAAYDTYVAQKRLDVQKKKFEEDQAKLQQERQEFEAKKTEAPSPTDDGRGATVPPFQRRIQGLETQPELGAGAPFGSGVLSAQIAEAYRKGELAGVTKPN